MGEFLVVVGSRDEDTINFHVPMLHPRHGHIFKAL